MANNKSNEAIIIVQTGAAVFFRLDEELGLEVGEYSPALQRDFVWLSGLLPYEPASQVVARFGRLSVAANTLWRCTRRHGERLLEAEQARQAAAQVAATPPPRTAEACQPKSLSMDGGMVHIRGEGWKEMKVASIGTVEATTATHPAAMELPSLVHLTHLRYTAVLGEVAPFRQAVWTLVLDTDFHTTSFSSVVADGAPWIWNLSAEVSPDSIQIVDFYHAAQHLSQAAQALFPSDPAPVTTWNDRMRDHLKLGQVWVIIHTLNAANLPEHAHYFITHQRRMAYQEFRENGFPIGSGAVESAVKQFKARLTGAGMSWSRPAAEQMLVLRAAVLSDTFDALWQAA
jgi:hypothetical protein